MVEGEARGDRAASPQVVVVVASTSAIAPARALTAALGSYHRDWHVRQVWAGDPQLGPRRGTWHPHPLTEYELAVAAPSVRPLLAAASAVAGLPSGPVVVLVAGTVGVAGPLDALVAPDSDVVVVPRVGRPIEPDDLEPSWSSLAETGMYSASAIAFGAAARDAAAWLHRALADQPDLPIAVALALLAATHSVTHCTDPAIGVSVWRWDDRAALVDAPHFDTERPWLLDPTLGGPPRVSISASPRRDLIASIADQLGAAVEPLRLPGGTSIDDDVRAVLRRHGTPALRPWGAPTAVRELLDRHYWLMLHERHADLRDAYPSPVGRDSVNFASWARGAMRDGRAPLLVDPAAVGRRAATRTADRPEGVNLVGYFEHQSGIADVARRVADVLGRHGVPHTTVAYRATIGPVHHDPPPVDDRLEYSTTIAFVNGDQVHHLRRDLPDVFGPRRRVVGVWFWELDTVDGAEMGFEHVDEIWAATTFMADAFARRGTVPVRVVPIPMALPTPTNPDRRTIAPVAAADDRFVFGVVLDHLSVTARKNPVGVIRAFRRAFAPEEGPLLVVKTINGRRCWSEHERLLAEAAGRADVVIWDEHLSKRDHLAFVESCDALVSLHRSEGLGLHLAEAMALGVPVIATRYSGNVDFMDDSSSLLVDYELVPVGTDGGWAYPPTAQWAEPDLAQAAGMMRRIVSDRALAAELSEAGRRRIAATPGELDFVEHVRRELGLGPVAAATH